MIRYTLRCAEGHSFESWFGSSSAFESVRAAGHISCAICGSTEVEKAMMAPMVRAGASQPEPEPPAEAPAGNAGPLSRPLSPAEQAIRALRRKIEATAENVGRDFASEARRIHEGEADARPIYGEATRAEAVALIEDRIPVVPLPFGPRKTN